MTPCTVPGEKGEEQEKGREEKTDEEVWRSKRSGSDNINGCGSISRLGQGFFMHVNVGRVIEENTVNPLKLTVRTNLTSSQISLKGH